MAAVPVRMGSTRLPGKAMREVRGQPLLGYLLDRLDRCRHLGGVVVATTGKAADDVIAAYCRGRGVACFRGPEDDLLARLLGALKSAEATIGVEVFGDCPLIDPAIVDEIVAFFLEHRQRFDFVGNDLVTTYPPGMEVEVFGVAALEDTGRRAVEPEVREHGTLFMRQHPDLYRLHNIEAGAEFRRPELEIEVDTPEDFTVISRILEHFDGRTDYSLGEIIAFLDANPDLKALNADVPRRWKALRDGII